MPDQSHQYLSPSEQKIIEALRSDPNLIELLKPMIEMSERALGKQAEQALRIRAARRSRKNLHGPRSEFAVLISALGGILRCGYCGSTVKTWQGHGKYRYYGCQLKNGRTCPQSRMVKDHHLNKAVVENLLNTLSNMFPKTTTGDPHSRIHLPPPEK